MDPPKTPLLRKTKNPEEPADVLHENPETRMKMLKAGIKMNSQKIRQPRNRMTMSLEELADALHENPEIRMKRQKAKVKNEHCDTDQRSL